MVPGDGVGVVAPSQPQGDGVTACNGRWWRCQREEGVALPCPERARDQRPLSTAEPLLAVLRAPAHLPQVTGVRVDESVDTPGSVPYHRYQ